MALIKCNECEGNVSDKAGACPHCGAPIKLEEVYNDIEKDIVTVKTSNIALTIICGFVCFVGLYWTYLLFTTTTAGIYSFIPLIICVLISLIEIYNLKNSHITLTNKRVTGKLVKLFESIEIDYPLREIKNVSVFGCLGISHFRISNGYQWFQIGCAVNGKKFKKEYFNLIENKYKYN